jgi:hypothetical protein
VPNKRAKKEHTRSQPTLAYIRPTPPIIRRPPSLLAVVVRLPSWHSIVRRLLASRRQPPPPPRATTSPPTSSLRVLLLLPPPSRVARRAVHRPLLPPPTAVVNRLLLSSCIFVRRLLSFSSSPRLLPAQIRAVDTAADDAGWTSRRLAILMYFRFAYALTTPVRTSRRPLLVLPSDNAPPLLRVSPFRPRRSR